MIRDDEPISFPDENAKFTALIDEVAEVERRRPVSWHR